MPGGATIKSLGAAALNSAMTAAMTAAILVGGQSVIAPPDGPAPGPAPAPAPVVTDFGQAVVEAFQSEGGTAAEAAERGRDFLACARLVERDAQRQPPKLGTGRDLAQWVRDFWWFDEVQWASYPRTKGLIHQASNDHVGGGPLDELRRANAAKIYREAGEALIELGGGE